MPQKKNGLFVIESQVNEQPYNWAVGLYGSKFLADLRDHKKITATKCPKCKHVYYPPRRVCGPCFVEMDEFITLKNTGTIRTYTILRFPIYNPQTGEKRPVPFGVAVILLDQASSCMQHFVEISKNKKIEIGARVEAVFADKRKGQISDILHFRLV